MLQMMHQMASSEVIKQSVAKYILVVMQFWKLKKWFKNLSQTSYSEEKDWGYQM